MSLSLESVAAYRQISNSPYEAGLYTLKEIPNAHSLAVEMQDLLQEMPSVNVNDGNVNPSDGNENPNADAKRR